MSRKQEIMDDDGNVLAPPEAGTDVANLIYLLEYGRKRGFVIGPTVKIGETTIQVADLRQRAQEGSKGDNRLPDLVPGSDMATLLAGDD